MTQLSLYSSAPSTHHSMSVGESDSASMVPQCPFPCKRQRKERHTSHVCPTNLDRSTTPTGSIPSRKPSRRHKHSRRVKLYQPKEYCDPVYKRSQFRTHRYHPFELDYYQDHRYQHRYYYDTDTSSSYLRYRHRYQDYYRSRSSSEVNSVPESTIPFPNAQKEMVHRCCHVPYRATKKSLVPWYRCLKSRYNLPQPIPALNL